jgi:formylglycine-generating enzyme required for sulfatase activity
MKMIALLIALFPISGVAAAAPPTKLRVIKDCRDCAEMVVLPGGTFQMGSRDNEAGRMTAEGPQHPARVSGFAIGRYDVTVGEWKRFAAATNRPTGYGCEWAGLPRDQNAKASWRTLGFTQTDRDPVVCVSWHDAQDYAAWMTKRTGHAYRLPTEAEWEYAARGGTTTAYPWGDQPSHDRANYGADTCCSERAEGKDRWLQTSPVGSFPPNAFGLYDMIGNAWQWIDTCFEGSYRLDATAAPKGGKCEKRVLRGGTWGDTPALIRVAFRNWSPAPNWPAEWEYRSGGVGFRLVREIGR